MCTVIFGTSAVRKESGDRPEKGRMREQQGAVRLPGQEMFRLKMKKEARQRDTEREGERHSVKKKHQRAIHDMNLGNARERQLGVQTEGASVLVIKQFNRDLFPRLVFHETIEKILHRSSHLRLCGIKGSPGPQKLRGGDGVQGFPDISGR